MSLHKLTSYQYWSRRRCRAAALMRWHGLGLTGAFAALDDSGYCLDRPESFTGDEVENIDFQAELDRERNRT